MTNGSTLPQGHSLANRRSLTLLEVAREPFISLLPTSDTRITTEQYCKESGFEQNVVIECAEWHHIRELVKMGMGIAFFPKFSWFNIDEEPGISFVSITSPKCSRDIVMSWDPDNYLGRSARLFKEFTVDFFQKLVA